MRVLCICSYKGTAYQGWQKQKDAPTIQETIESVLSKILNTPITIYGSGRTDSSVHAKKQYFHFDIDRELDLDKFRYSVNCLLPKDIFISEMKQVSEDFHARYSAKGKTYQYVIHFGPRDPLNFDFECSIPYEIDVNLLCDALKEFEGEHNFRDFTSKEEDEDGYIREIYSVKTEFNKEDNRLVITFNGDGFMRYQIRYMVGTAIAVASHKENADYIKKHLDNTGNRDVVSHKAEPQGLFLVEVNY